MARSNIQGWSSFLQGTHNTESGPNIVPSPANAPLSNSATPTSADGPPTPAMDSNFDILKWWPAYQSCQKYFINHAQYQGLVQAVAAFTNIRLPYQWSENPLRNLTNIDPQSNNFSANANVYPPQPTPSYQNAHAQASSSHPLPPALPFASLIPYIRRLIVTGFDNEAILGGFFGSDWREGIGPYHEIERRNYLFAAKSVGFAQAKHLYDIEPDQTVPFIKPLQNVQNMEIEKAEKGWSEYLAMEDWLLGPRAPSILRRRPSVMSFDDKPNWDGR